MGVVKVVLLGLVFFSFFLSFCYPPKSVRVIIMPLNLCVSAHQTSAVLILSPLPFQSRSAAATSVSPPSH